MSTNFQKHDNDALQRRHLQDAHSADSRMCEGHEGNEPLSPPARPDRRLRNTILLVNAIVWSAIIFAVRWLFF